MDINDNESDMNDHITIIRKVELEALEKAKVR